MTALIILCAKYLFVLAPLGVVLVFARADGGQRRAILRRGIIVLALGILFAKAGGAIYYNPRPFVDHHTTPLIPHAADNGFPSDHTLLAFACAFLVWPFSLGTSAVLCGVGLIVGIARVGSGLHQPIDIAAGAFFAAIANVAAAIAVQMPDDYLVRSRQRSVTQKR